MIKSRKVIETEKDTGWSLYFLIKWYIDIIYLKSVTINLYPLVFGIWPLDCHVDLWDVLVGQLQQVQRLIGCLFAVVET